MHIGITIYSPGIKLTLFPDKISRGFIARAIARAIKDPRDF